MTIPHSFELLAGNLQGCPDPSVPIAASRWGATGLLNLEGAPADRARAALDRFLAFGRGALAIKVDGAVAKVTTAASSDAIGLFFFSTTT